MNVSKKQLQAVDAYALRAIAAGKYRGVASSNTDKQRAKDELKRRGLAVTKKKTAHRCGWW